MKIDGTEIAPSGKPRLKIYLGEDELAIMSRLVKNACRYTPDVQENVKTCQWLREMDRTFTNHFEAIKQAETAKQEKTSHALPKDWIIIHFDGGTPCNIPSKGYGDGYGSYRITDSGVESEIVRLKFGQAMSANTAEIRTVAEAIKKVSELHGTRKWLHVIGDSQIALKWVSNAHNQSIKKISKGSSPLFREAIDTIYEVISPFEKVITEWNPRDRMVQIFGH